MPGLFEGSNERLEFLGDAVLDLIVAQELVERFPEHPEGHLTQMRSSIVDGRSLASVGRRLEVGPWLLMGRGEAEKGGTDRDSNLANAVEALVAAVFLDQGYDAAQDFVLHIMREELDAIAQFEEPRRHPKSLLHESAMELGFRAPVYELVSQEGPDHAPTFTVRAVVDGRTVGTGEGPSKQEAEAEAATVALERLAGCD